MENKKIRVKRAAYWVNVGIIVLLFSLLDKVLLWFYELFLSPERLLTVVIILVVLLILIIIDLTIAITKMEISINGLAPDINLVKLEDEQKDKEK